MKTPCAGCGAPTEPEGFPHNPRRRDGRGETCLRCCAHSAHALSLTVLRREARLRAGALRRREQPPITGRTK